jgi:hypothetical protein
VSADPAGIITNTTHCARRAKRYSLPGALVRLRREHSALWFANISTAERITTQTCASQPGEDAFGPSPILTIPPRGLNAVRLPIRYACPYQKVNLPANGHIPPRGLNAVRLPIRYARRKTVTSWLRCAG